MRRLIRHLFEVATQHVQVKAVPIRHDVVAARAIKRAGRLSEVLVISATPVAALSGNLRLPMVICQLYESVSVFAAVSNGLAKTVAFF